MNFGTRASASARDSKRASAIRLPLCALSGDQHNLNSSDSFKPLRAFPVFRDFPAAFRDFSISAFQHFSISSLNSPALPFVLLALLLLSPSAFAQRGPNTTRVGYVYPAGGRQGSRFQVVVGGQFLTGPTNVFISGHGIDASAIQYVRPLTQKELNDLRQEMTDLQAKRASVFTNAARARSAANAQSRTNAPRATGQAWSAEDQKRLADIRREIALRSPRNQMNPAISENVILQVTVAPDAEPGRRELRLQCQQGLSNPLVFEVGQLPEFSKLAATLDAEAALGRGMPQNPNSRTATPPTEREITLPAIVNGQIMPGGVDRMKFKARKGQRLVFVVQARDLIPYLPDAVPGWFQASVSLYDSKGRELEYADHFQFHPDPVLFYEVPRDDEYTMEIRDSIYRGREDFVYRISVGELPYITSIFPLGCQAGTQATVQLQGWNLPETTLAVDAKDSGIRWLAAGKGDRVSNRVPFSIDPLPDIREHEPNNTTNEAQAVTLPIIINGRIDRPGDWDVFRFDGHAGQEFVAEVYARRLDSPLDSVIKLTDASGRQLAFNDDYEDKGSGLNTHHADSWLRVKLPTDGAYYLHLGDAQQKGGPEYAYRLRLSAPRPDFELRAVPSSLSVRAGSSVPLTVYALRRDGFTKEITLALKDAPRGFSLSGGLVPAGTNQVPLTIKSAAAPELGPVRLTLEGRALIDGQPAARPVVPAEDMMQAFIYRHLVPMNDLQVAVMGRGPANAGVRILSEMPVKIPAGGTVRVRIAVPQGVVGPRAQLELTDPPEGIALQNVNLAGLATEVVLGSDPELVKLGERGNLIITAYAGQVPAAAARGKAPPRRPPLATFPAISFVIVP
jgi:hypothetical protein